MKEESAQGLTGILISGNGSLFLRIYHATGNFTDYDIYNRDMEITINDSDAFLKFPKNEEPFIDYSNRTLGVKNEDD